MGWQFRKTKSFGPLRLSASKRGLGASIGGSVLRVGVGADRKVRRTIRIPGTGLSNVKTFGKGR